MNPFVLLAIHFQQNVRNVNPNFPEAPGDDVTLLDLSEQVSPKPKKDVCSQIREEK